MAPESLRRRVSKKASRLRRGEAVVLGKLTIGRPPAGLRRALGLILVAVLCVSAVTFYRDALELPRSAPVATTSTPLPTAPASTAGTPPSPSPTISATPAGPTAPRQVRLPKGPGTTQPGVLLMASPLRDGSFDIAEMVYLSAPVSSVRLGPPEVTMAGDRFAKLKPVASQVQMSAGDQPVVVPKGRVGNRVDVALVEPAKQMELRYNLSGVTVRSIPSRAGRAVAAITPLASGSPNLRVVMMVSGDTVLNIECPMRRGISEQACVAGRVPHLRARGELPLSRAVIVVQFNLPRT